MDIALSAASLWMMAAGVMMVLEMVGISGIGLIFAGLAALSVGIALRLGFILENSYLWQWAWFLLLTAIWAALLWRPLQRLTNRKGSGYTNLIGETAKLTADIEPGQEGAVRWSGTTMRAHLQEGEAALPAGTEVEITAVEGNLLTVKKK
jgi:membrane protein implicated in regulation of membrane protease activity